MMPEGKKIGKVVLDSEYYTNESMEYLNERGVKWATAALPTIGRIKKRRLLA